MVTQISESKQGMELLSKGDYLKFIKAMNLMKEGERFEINGETSQRTRPKSIKLDR